MGQKIKVTWDTEVAETYEAEVEVPEDMTAEEFFEAIKDDPDEYLAGYGEGAKFAVVNERYVTTGKPEIVADPAPSE